MSIRNSRRSGSSSVAPGDLAYKKISRRCKAIGEARSHLDVPVIGGGQSRVESGSTSRAGVTIAWRNNGGVDPGGFRKVDAALLHYVDGDYQDPATFGGAPQELKDAPIVRRITSQIPACFV